MSEAHYNTCKRHWRQWDARACMASSDGVSFGDVYFYTRHTECAIFEMTDLSPIEHAFDKGQTKGRMTSTQQRQKTAAKNSIIKETHSLLCSTGNLRAFIIRIKTKQTAHLLTPAEGCHNKRKCSFNPCFLYIFLKLSSYTFIGTTKVKKKLKPTLCTRARVLQAPGSHQHCFFFLENSERKCREYSALHPTHNCYMANIFGHSAVKSGTVTAAHIFQKLVALFYLSVDYWATHRAKGHSKRSTSFSFSLQIYEWWWLMTAIYIS